MGHFTPKGTLPGNGVPQILCPSLAASPPGRLGWDCMPWDEALQFFPHSNGVAQGSQMTSGFREGKEMPIPEQTSTTAGRGGSCSNAVPATAPGRGTVGYPYFFSTLTDEGPFAAQYGHTVFPSLDASRISPFLFFSAAPSLSRTLECSWYLSCKHATSYARRGF